ncbi:23S rRNA (uracil(747)-C(5))-methyltransferase RlmC [Nocardioides sp.]|uniref:23S rRNA (uracil(747)-C(5))-methyltransferase RlmC n=1 Tax=Nocardioides sp. TaxID=35761 RepID=UPI002735C939|nr:23S rRNA (uracil(747)-C(5))-methyltransferase RlmC [Nocardioides sp.]MDP3894228.1 23S rRNA (uracil(747)-C(5))-methyltransferase RlmC [Nocardioides sp.]
MSLALDCHHFAAGRCRSCTWLERPYDDQLAAKDEACRGLLAPYLAADASAVWVAPEPSPRGGFRNKAKMVVTGTVEEPVLGIWDPVTGGVDLRDCPLHDRALVAALPTLAAFVTRAGITPYDIAARRGELKHLLVTASPDGELMVRFVLRSTEAVGRIRKHLAWLHSELPAMTVTSVNLQPEPKAVLEGPEEIVLGEAQTLTMRLAEATLHLRPQSFFQTNTAVATALYRRATEWVEEVAPSSLWDLYCGVGGFALHAAAPGRRVTGVEVSVEAVASAQQSAGGSGVEAMFVAADATGYALGAAAEDVPDLVVVNPPRRGIGEDLSCWLETSGVRHVVYSSCNATTLARDLAAMPSLRVRRAQVLDMFPHTTHHEVLTLLERA